jgi:tryptophan synthase alpha chain
VIDLEKRFSELKLRGEKALMPFFTIGYPDMKKSLELIRAASRSGADIIEVGIPFSDPIADGPSVQFSSQESLKNGTTLRGALSSLEGLEDEINVPIVIMTYYNLILSMGIREFAEAVAPVPVSGVIIPDLPPEEGGELEKLLREVGVDTIYLVAPTSTKERMALVAGRSRGFIYAVSVTGVTGARRDLPPELNTFITGIKQSTSKPVCVGFGISTKEHAEMLAPMADGIIIGSAIVEIIKHSKTDPVAAVSKYLKDIKGVL